MAEVALSETGGVLAAAAPKQSVASATAVRTHEETVVFMTTPGGHSSRPKPQLKAVPPACKRHTDDSCGAELTTRWPFAAG